jgi:hypothetical protein
VVDAAYYRRQAATCRTVAQRFRRPEHLLELAAYFDRQAMRDEERYGPVEPPGARTSSSAMSPPAIMPRFRAR